MSAVQTAETMRRTSILTPEGVRIDFEVAGAGDRVLAFLIDVVLIHALVVGLSMLGFLASTLSGGLALSFALLASFLLRNFYFVFMEMRHGGATLGKRKMGLRVVARDGGPLTAEAIFARNLTRDLEVFLPLTAMIRPDLLIGTAPGWSLLAGTAWLFLFALLPLFNHDRLRCGDLVGGTMVVRMPRTLLLHDLARERAHRTHWEQEDETEPFRFTAEQLDLYGIHELQVLEQVLRDSGGYRHGELMERICERVKTKIGWPRAAWSVDPHAFLLSFYKAQRARLEHQMLFGQRRERKRR